MPLMHFSLGLRAFAGQVARLCLLQLARATGHRSRVSRPVGSTLIPVLVVLGVLLVLVILPPYEIFELPELHAVCHLVEVVGYLAQGFLVLANLPLLFMI